MNVKKIFAMIVSAACMAVLLAASPVMARDTQNNEDVTTRIKREAEPYKDVTFKNDQGHVTISGTVATQQEKDALDMKIRNMSGVKSVKNDVHVKGKSSETMGGFIDDASITTVVKSKIFGQRGLDSLDISVKTHQGVVTLTGVVDEAGQIALAERVAKEVDGVKRVENKLTVKK